MIFDFFGGCTYLKHLFVVAGNTLKAEIRPQKAFRGGSSLLKQPFFTLLRWLYLPPLKISTKGTARKKGFTSVLCGGGEIQ